MTQKEFVFNRICNFAGKVIDPNSDDQVKEMLRVQLNIFLPQRRSMNDALSSSNSTHEVISLILKYREMA